MIEQEIQAGLGTLFQDMPAKTVSRVAVEHILKNVSHHIETHVRHSLLMSLRTVDDVAVLYGITPRRVREIARRRSERGFPIGWQVPGTSQWLFLPEDLEALRPQEKYRRK